MRAIACGIKATTITPFSYHSLMVQSGSATLPELISDRAVAFGLAAGLGMMNRSVALPPKDYKKHLAALPWRAPVFFTEHPRLLPPLLRYTNLDTEGGFPKKLDDVTRKGNFKRFYHIQEVPQDQEFYGALFGFDPFAQTGLDYLIIRIGLQRNGMIKLEPFDVPRVCLNASTAALFKRELGVSRYILHSIQVTAPMPIEEALEEILQWR